MELVSFIICSLFGDIIFPTLRFLHLTRKENFPPGTDFLKISILGLCSQTTFPYCSSHNMKINAAQMNQLSWWISQFAKPYKWPTKNKTPHTSSPHRYCISGSLHTTLIRLAASCSFGTLYSLGPCSLRAWNTDFPWFKKFSIWLPSNTGLKGTQLWVPGSCLPPFKEWGDRKRPRAREDGKGRNSIDWLLLYVY